MGLNLSEMKHFEICDDEDGPPLSLYVFLQGVCVCISFFFEGENFK